MEQLPRRESSGKRVQGHSLLTVFKQTISTGMRQTAGLDSRLRGNDERID